MENASKALFLSTGILLGVLIISFATYLYIFMSDYAKTVHDNLNSKEIYEFNTEFQKFDGRSDLTAQDVLSIWNLKENFNSKFDDGNSDPQAIKVILPAGVSIDTILNTSLSSEQIYHCKISYGNGRVSIITITKK